MLYTIIGLLVIILDQGVKMWVDKVINYTNTSIELIPGVLSLVRVQNDGAAFSFLAGGGARIWFIALTLIFTVIVVIALVTNFISGKFGRWCMVLVTAGGLSNCLDRVLYGFVIDMFKIELFDFAVFNVADIFITVFCIAFIIYILFGGEKERDLDEEDEFDEDEEEDDHPRRAKKAKKDKYADLYEEDEEEVSRSRRSRKAAEDEDDEYEAERKPRRASRKADKYDDDERFEEMFGSGKETKKGKKKAESDRKARRAAYDEEEEEVPVSRRQSRKAPVKEEAEEPVQSRRSAKAAPQYEEEDPFAAWERANSGRTANTAPADVPVKKAFRQTVSEAAREDVPRQSSFEGFDLEEDFVKPAVSKAKSAAAKAADDFDEFDLDSILNEFK